jgi:hypothetical protein
MAQANTDFQAASEVPVPRVRPRIESNNSVKDLVDKFSRNSATSQASKQGQSRTSFAGLDSFDEVRRGFEFGPNRPAFYPPVSFSREHNKHDSIFSIASVSSYGSVIDNGAPDPFGYSRHSRPPSEDMSVSMSMSVDDTFSFMYQKRRSRVDSDASSFYFRSQPSAGRDQSGADTGLMIPLSPPEVPLPLACTTAATTDIVIVGEIPVEASARSRFPTLYTVPTADVPPGPSTLGMIPRLIL